LDTFAGYAAILQCSIVMSAAMDPSKVAVDEETSPLGVPLRWMWVPYALVTVGMLSMMIYSFYNYHKKNSHRYRRKSKKILCCKLGGYEGENEEEWSDTSTIQTVMSDSKTSLTDISCEDN